MKRLISLFCFYACLLSSPIIAQDYESATICDLYRASIKAENTKLIDSLLKDNPTDSIHLIRLLEARAIANNTFYKRMLKKNDTLDILKYKEVIKDFDNLVRVRQKMNLAPSNAQIKRYLSLSDYGDYANLKEDEAIYNRYNKDEIKEGIGLTPTVRFNGNLWVGGELSFFNVLFIDQGIKDETGKFITKPSKNDGMLSLVTIGYHYNINKGNESLTTFSPIAVKTPITIDLFQVGLHHKAGGYSFFYLPEIGLGRNGISLTYGYIVFFRKGVSVDNRHFLSLRYTYTFQK